MDYLTDGPVLLLGEGNFSFARSLTLLCRSRGFKSSLVATALQTQEQLNRCKSTSENIAWLQCNGVETLFQIDATQLEITTALRERKFLLVIFNFPHPGGKTNLRKCRALLKSFFISATNVLEESGKIIVTLAKGQGGLDDWFSFGIADVDHSQNGLSRLQQLHNLDSWQATYIGAYANLVLERISEFDSESFPEYKCTGYRSTTKGFHICKAQQFMFKRAPILSPETLNFLPVDVTYLNVLRPFYVHDVAFWIESEFDEKQFTVAVKSISRQFVKMIFFLEQFSFMTDSPMSFCYRIVWSSDTCALTKENCRDLQLLLRDQLPVIMYNVYSSKITIR